MGAMLVGAYAGDQMFVKFASAYVLPIWSCRRNCRVPAGVPGLGTSRRAMVLPKGSSTRTFDQGASGALRSERRLMAHKSSRTASASERSTPKIGW